MPQRTSPSPGSESIRPEPLGPVPSADTDTPGALSPMQLLQVVPKVGTMIVIAVVRVAMVLAMLWS